MRCGRKQREVGVGVQGKLMRWDKGVKHKLDFFLCSLPSVKHYDGKPSLPCAAMPYRCGIVLLLCGLIWWRTATKGRIRGFWRAERKARGENQRHALTDLKLPTNYTEWKQHSTPVAGYAVQTGAWAQHLIVNIQISWCICTSCASRNVHWKKCILIKMRTLQMLRMQKHTFCKFCKLLRMYVSLNQISNITRVAG